jgi:HEAT repeat protein
MQSLSLCLAIVTGILPIAGNQNTVVDSVNVAAEMERAALVSHILRDLNSVDDRCRYRAIRSLCSLSSQTNATEALIINALTDADAEIVRTAMRYLARRCISPKKVVPILTTMIAAEDKTSNCHDTVLALASYGATAKQALPHLIRKIQRSDHELRRLILMSLVAIDAGCPDVQKVLLQGTQDEAGDVRLEAVWGLYKSSGWTALTKRVVSDCLCKCRDKYVRVQAAILAGELGSDGKDLVAALIEALGDTSEDVRQASASALGQIKQCDKSVLPALIGAMKDSDCYTRLQAARSLGFFGNEIAVKTLRAACNDEDGLVRVTAALAIWRIQGKADGVLRTLISALSDKDEYVRTGAINAFAELGTAANEAVPYLRKALKDEWSIVREAAAAAIETIE